MQNNNIEQNGKKKTKKKTTDLLYQHYINTYTFLFVQMCVKATCVNSYLLL